MSVLMSTGNIFSFARPRRPKSTLFPYTTLFRSLLVPTTSGNWGSQSTRGRQTMMATLSESEKTVGGRDRKSTRLNSSHQINSYAVFCLKKKKTLRVTKGKRIGDRLWYVGVQHF